MLILQIGKMKWREKESNCIKSHSRQWQTWNHTQASDFLVQFFNFFHQDRLIILKLLTYIVIKNKKYIISAQNLTVCNVLLHKYFICITIYRALEIIPPCSPSFLVFVDKSPSHGTCEGK